MSIIQAIILGLVQGLTEFIPVSSSGHLVAFHQLFGSSTNDLTFDIALHVGTLAALIIYFHKDIMMLIKGFFGKTQHTRLVWFIVLATIPASVLGFLFSSKAETAFRSLELVALNMLIFGVIMLLAEKYAIKYRSKAKDLTEINTKQALVVGFAQSLAVIPGVSRSGSTITAGLFAGINRVSATRFSFLLGIPIIAGATLKVLTESQSVAVMRSEWSIFVIGTTTALISGMFAIGFLLKYLSNHTLAVFAYYRIAFGVVVLISALLF